MDKYMKYSELVKAVHALFPGAVFNETADGELQINTNYFHNAELTRMFGNGEGVYYEPENTPVEVTMRAINGGKQAK